MKQIVVDTRVTSGHLKLKNIPFDDDTEVKVIIIPKAKLSRMSFRNSQRFTKSIKGNLSDDIISERSEK